MTKDEEFTVKINFNILAILLTEDKIKQSGFKPLKKLIKNLKSLIKPFEFLISKTDVKVIEYGISYPEESRFPIFKVASFLISLRLIFSYLEKNARRVIYQECITGTYSAPGPFFDISLHFSLWNLIIFLLLFLYYTVKNKIKKVLKNV